MGVVRSVFLNEQQARNALERLRAEFADDRINMRFFRSAKTDPGEFASDYDPLGGVRLAGTAITTLPATGANIIGNSTTMDLSLGELDDILAIVAEGERRNQYRRSATRIVASVEVDSEAEAETARKIIDACGGRSLSLDKRDMPGSDQPDSTTDSDQNTDNKNSSPGEHEQDD